MNALRVMEVIYVLILLTVLVSMLIQWRLLDILKRLSALSRLDTKLDLLLKQAGIEYDPYTNLPLDVVDAVKRGNKIGAIKRYRERTGVGLKEARTSSKKFSEELESASSWLSLAGPSPGWQL